MSLELLIIDYLTQRSGGRVRITERDARKLIEIVKRGVGSARAKIFKWSGLKESWELLREISIEEDQINKAIRAEIQRKTIIEKFFRIEMYNAKGMFEGYVYTIDSDYFDHL